MHPGHRTALIIALMLVAFSPLMPAYDLAYSTITQQAWTGSCIRTSYTPVNNFLTTDTAAYLYFEINNVSPTDYVTNQWIQPTNTVFADGHWDVASGNRCYHATLDIASAASTLLTGTWHARVFVSGAQLFDLPFTITISPRGTPSPIITWLQQPPGTVQNGQSFPVQWRITGGQQAAYSHLHIGTDQNVKSTPAKTTDRAAISGDILETISPSDLLSTSLAPGTIIYYVVHLAADPSGSGAEPNYYSDILQSAVGSTVPPATTDTITLFSGGSTTPLATWLGPQAHTATDTANTPHRFHVFAVAHNIDRTAFKVSIKSEGTGSFIMVDLPGGLSNLTDDNSGGVLIFTLPFGMTVTAIDAINASLGARQPGGGGPMAKFFSCEFNSIKQDLLNQLLSKALWGFSLLDVDCVAPIVRGALSIPSAGDMCDITYPIINSASSDCLSDQQNNSLFGERTLNTHQTRHVQWKPGGSLPYSRIQFHFQQSKDQVLTLIGQMGITIYATSPTGDLFLDNWH